MNNQTAFSIAALVVLAVILDLMLFQAAAMLYIGQHWLRLINILAFWR